MKRYNTLITLLVLLLTIGGIVYLALPGRDQAQHWEQRKLQLLQVTRQAQPLIDAIRTYTAAAGQPPGSIADLIPDYLDSMPDTGVRECSGFEYRSLADKQGSIVWYDLGSRHGEPRNGESRFSDGDPDHAILVFILDATARVGGAVIDRLPKDHEPVEFDRERWQDGGDRIGMALALAETYRLYGMPRTVIEELLGAPDGSRGMHTSPWEVRTNCPTGLFSHDSLVYWPDTDYPPHLYGGVTEAIGNWVYVHSTPLLH